jgi:hypothetical protein
MTRDFTQAIALKEFEMHPTKLQIASLWLTTIALLVVFRFAGYIPIPGLDLAGAGNFTGSNFQRFSIVALGMVPWLSALTLVEFAVLVLPVSLGERFARNGHAKPFSAEVILIALLIAALQGYGVTTALMHVPNLVDDPDTWFQASAILTLVAGTVLTVAIAHLIERHGIGYGFWVMLATWSLGAFETNLIQFFRILAIGQVGPLTGLLVLVGDIIIVVAVVALLKARAGAGLPNAEPIIWPPVLAPLITGWIIGLMAFISPAAMEHGVYKWLLPNTPFGLVLHAVIVSMVVVRYANRGQSRAFMLPTAALAIGATLISQFTWTVLKFQPLLGGANTIIVASVLFVIVHRHAGIRNLHG